MSDELNPRQALLLWRMLSAEDPLEREPAKSKARPRLANAELESLVARGFISAERRPPKRGTYLTLTEKAWAWAERASDVAILKSRSSVAAETLQDLLRRLLPFLREHELPLASLFSRGVDVSPPAEPVGGARVDTAPADTVNLSSQIEAACLSLAGGARKQRVRLRALRRRLNSVQRDLLDQTLLELQNAGRLVLYREDNTAALTAEDHNAALIVGGAPRHLVLLEA